MIQKTFQQKKHGFMLIELSIAIVVIGLLFAGVSSGVSLIQKAKIQSALTQIDSLKNSAIMFKANYGKEPGILTSTREQFANSISDGTDKSKFYCLRDNQGSASSGVFPSLAAEGNYSGVTGVTSGLKVDNGTGAEMDVQPSYSTIAMCQLYASKTLGIAGVPGATITPDINAPAFKLNNKASVFYISNSIGTEYYIAIGDAANMVTTTPIFDGTIGKIKGNIAGDMLKKIDMKLSTGKSDTGDFVSAKNNFLDTSGTISYSAQCNYDTTAKECVSLFRLDM